MRAVGTTCPKCSGTMEAGFMLDKTHGSSRAIEWFEGIPKKSFWTGIRYGGLRHMLVQSFRCTGCGYLEQYARSEKVDPDS